MTWTFVCLVSAIYSHFKKESVPKLFIRLGWMTVAVFIGFKVGLI